MLLWFMILRMLEDVLCWLGNCLLEVGWLLEDFDS